MKSIPPFRLILEPLSDEAKAMPKFRWAPPEVGTRNQIGGAPAFIQSTEHPCCPQCHQAMTFFAQLDSISDEVCLADCGLVYVFVCFDCYETASFIQSN